MMKRIIIHWTAGTYTVNDIDFSHYHYLIDRDGNTIPGVFVPEDNLDCTDDNYAAHVAGLNTGSIGIAAAGMYGFNMKDKKTDYPLTRTQMEALFKKCAELVKKYNIPINGDAVITHYEVGIKNPDTPNHGKIDIVYLPYLPDIKSSSMGDYIRNKISWYYNRL